MNETFFFHSSRVGEVDTAAPHEGRRSGRRVGTSANGKKDERTLDELADGASGARVGPQGRQIRQTDILLDSEALRSGRRSGRVAHDNILPTAKDAELACVITIGHRVRCLRSQDLRHSGKSNRLVRILDVDQHESTLLGGSRGRRLDAASKGQRAESDTLANALVGSRTSRNGVEQLLAVGNGRVCVEVHADGRHVNGFALRRRNGTRLRAPEAAKRNGRRNGASHCAGNSTLRSHVARALERVLRH